MTDKPHPALARTAILVQRHLMGGPLVDPDLEAVAGILDSVLHYTELVEALHALKRGDCWCEAGVGNPMMQGRHSAACDRVRTLLAAIDGDQ